MNNTKDGTAHNLNHPNWDQIKTPRGLGQISKERKTRTGDIVYSVIIKGKEYIYFKKELESLYKL